MNEAGLGDLLGVSVELRRDQHPDRGRGDRDRDEQDRRAGHLAGLVATVPGRDESGSGLFPGVDES